MRTADKGALAYAQVGAVSTWPLEVVGTIRTILSCPTAISLFIGDDMYLCGCPGPSRPHLLTLPFARFYNDAYSPILGPKHPAMGRRVKDVLPEVPEELIERFRAVARRGVSYADEDLEGVLERPTPEEGYFTFTGSPLRAVDGRALGGIFVSVEHTREVKSRRRMAVLQQLSECASAAVALRTQGGAAGAHVQTVAERCVEVLKGNVKDIPFAALYLLNDDASSATLVNSVGVTSAHIQDRLLPASVSISGAPSETDVWSLRDFALGACEERQFTDLVSRFGEITTAPFNRAPHTAHAYAIHGSTDKCVMGVLVLGQSALLARSDESDFRKFTKSVAQNVSSALVTALAAQEGASHTDWEADPPYNTFPKHTQHIQHT